jgi:serine/threonine-protein kinase
MPFEPSPGALVADRYRLSQFLGEGGMGSVWAARHEATRKPLALKFLKAKGQRRPDVVRRFRREARAASAAVHPNLVQVHDILELADGTPVMVMELLEGESLQQRLERRGRLPLAEAVATMLPVLYAVGAAHEVGVVHRDLKPDNIFLARTADGTTVKVLDFGVAKVSLDADVATGSGLTATGALLGTPHYMSPEQALDEREVDARSDLWSIGIILYRALTGVLPTRGASLGQILHAIMVGRLAPVASLDPSIPPDVAELVDRMLSREREQRPESCAEVAAVLSRWAEPGHVLEAPPHGTIVRAALAGEAPAEAAPERVDAARAEHAPADPPARAREGETSWSRASGAGPSRRAPRSASRAALLAVAGAGIALASGVVGARLEASRSADDAAMRRAAAPADPGALASARAPSREAPAIATSEPEASAAPDATNAPEPAVAPSASAAPQAPRPRATTTAATTADPGAARPSARPAARLRRHHEGID